MKQYKILTLLSALCALFYASCVEYEDPALYIPTVTTGSVDINSITRTEGTITATITSPDVKTIKKAGFRYSLYETMEVPTEVKCNIESQGIKASLSNLETGKTYYYYAFASGGFNEVRGQVQSFTTKQYDAPALGKVTLSDLGENSLHASSSLIDNGGDALSNAGFVFCVCTMYEPDPEPSLTGAGWQVALYKNFASISNGTAFSDLIDNLVPGTEYALCAFATNKASLTGYSEVVRFRTIAHTEEPQVDLVNIISNKETEMQVSSSVISTGGKEVTERGFCYSTSRLLPTIEDVCVKATGDDELFQSLISGLTPGQKYYVRAYAINEKGTGYSTAATDVTTPRYEAPDLSPTTLGNIEENSAEVIAYITSSGNADITESGFCISNSNKEPDKNDRVISVTTTTNQISTTISDLSRGTTYYIRAFATNQKGTGYGSVAEFTTADYRTEPSVGMAALESVTETSMGLTSSVSSDGGCTVTERGFCYSLTKTSPTLSDTYSEATGNDKSFSHQFTDLSPGKKYYVRAYATNEKGTGYSDAAIEVTTLTPDFFLATIGEITMSEVKEISSVATASIIDKGNTDVVFSGFYLSRTNSEPNKNEYDQFIPSESGLDDVISATIKGLVKNTTYYLRAFVSNAVGIAYSSTKVFTTANYVAPTVAAVVEEGAGNNEVTVSSSVSYNGGIEVTERGFCYSRTNSMPTLADNYVGATGTDASFQATITKLISGRTYYIRAYAKNERGTSYSNSALEVHVSGDDPFNGHDYVDLGLKDSEGNTIYWATCNVGADTPEDYGLYFAWGETVGYAQNDSHLFDWAHYSLCGGSSNTMKKYCIDSSFGTVDNKTVLEPEDDAATQNWGGNWRMPTMAEQDQLYNSCTWTWNSAKKGYTVKGKNGKSIFLPAAGYRNGSYLGRAGSGGLFWSSSLNTSDSDRAYHLNFLSSSVVWSSFYRYYGQSVRAVCVSIE